MPTIPSYGWTDSTIVLAWLFDYPRRWETFIANRTSEILEVLPRTNWRHVPSSKNPADMASRGVSASQLAESSLWWNGSPTILEDDIIQERQFPTTTIGLRKSVFLATTPDLHDHPILYRYSSLQVMKRIAAYCLCFYHNLKNKPGRRTGYLTTEELRCSFSALIRAYQRSTFVQEVNLVINGKQLPPNNRLSCLRLFVDSNGVMCVGGRLHNAQIEDHTKHPIISPKEGILTDLLIQDFHQRYLHAGPRLLMSLITRNFWMLSCRQAVGRIVFSCVTCTRHKGQPIQWQMGNLPSVRVQPARPFQNTGVDYAGPIMVRSWRGRSSKAHKAYIAVFVCMSTKACHIELVSSLSTEEFLAALRRFVSRRGLPSNNYSDNGSAFVGANRQLREIGELLQQRKHQQAVTSFAVRHEIACHFIPPHAPHFGGVWEAAVKKVKFHLRREIGNALLTFEELTTLLCQIEAILNSRPPCSAGASDNIDALTPAHFLIGSSLVTAPEVSYNENHINHLDRWQYVPRLQRSFWRRWHAEYILHLQERTKWKQTSQDLKLDSMVLSKDENQPPATWLFGRVTKLHPGNDGRVRAVTVRGYVTRLIAKLRLLPTS